MAISANDRTAATTEFTNSLAIITRTRFGVAAYVGRIVPCANSDVRLIAATALNSIDADHRRPRDQLGELVALDGLRVVAEDRDEHGHGHRERDGEDQQHEVHTDRAQLEPLAADREDHGCTACVRYSCSRSRRREERVLQRLGAHGQLVQDELVARRQLADRLDGHLVDLGRVGGRTGSVSRRALPPAEPMAATS